MIKSPVLAKYEILEVKGCDVKVDLRELLKKETIMFNATQIGKAFGKLPKDYLKTEQTKRYFEALKSQKEYSTLELVRVVRGGRNSGTWFHQKVAVDYLRWLSPEWAVKIDNYIWHKIRETVEWKKERVDTKTGYRPLTDAVKVIHKDLQWYHYSNEADLLNRIVFGMTATQYIAKYGVSIRDGATDEELKILKRLQEADAAFIDSGIADFQERKRLLKRMYRKLNPSPVVDTTESDSVRSVGGTNG